MSLKEVKTSVKNCHKNKQEAWIAGCISKDQMASLWKTGVDVICVRGAACETGTGRQGKVSAKKIADLISIIYFAK